MSWNTGNVVFSAVCVATPLSHVNRTPFIEEKKQFGCIERSECLQQQLNFVAVIRIRACENPACFSPSIAGVLDQSSNSASGDVFSVRVFIDLGKRALCPTRSVDTKQSGF